MPDHGANDARDVVQLLVEIRNLQREHLEEYRRVTEESLELMRRSAQRQERIGRLYRGQVAVWVIVLVALGLFLAWLVGAFR
jgi:hypothetical protein